MARGKVLAVVGAQYGSEGKGSIVAHLADRYEVHVLTGGPNAGHTFYRGDRPWVMQVLPCGWVNPAAALVIGPGAVISAPILAREVDAVREVDPSILDRVYVDERAGVVTANQEAEEGGVGGELHRRIGSTGKGVGACRIAKLRRDQDTWLSAGRCALLHDLGVRVVDTVGLLARAHQRGSSILLEGTQGSGLSLTHGPWPYVTTADTNAAQLAADAGIPPGLVSGTLLVARTYPIRVAGHLRMWTGGWESSPSRLVCRSQHIYLIEHVYFGKLHVL